MNALLAFLVLVFALVAVAAVFLLLVLFRRGPAGTYLALAAALIALAAGVWATTLRTPPPLP